MKHLKYFVDIILEKSIGSESIRLKYYSHIDKKLFYKIVNLDPTSVRKKEFSKPGKYSKWLLLQLKKGNLSQELLDDDSFYKEFNYYLFIFSTGWYRSRIISKYGETFFDEISFWKSRTDNNYLPSEDNKKEYTKSSSIYYDITKYKTVSDFIKHMEGYVKTYEGETEKSKFDVVYSDDKLDVLVPLNFSASYETAKNTEWCSRYLSGFSGWNVGHILFRIIPKDKEYDRVKLTWGKNRWFIATTKYPEIESLKHGKYKNYKPFDKVDGEEVWKIMADLEMDMMPDKYDYLWKKLEMTLNLLSDKAKQTINQYWKENILNKQ